MKVMKKCRVNELDRKKLEVIEDMDKKQATITKNIYALLAIDVIINWIFPNNDIKSTAIIFISSVILVMYAYYFYFIGTKYKKMEKKFNKLDSLKLNK